MADDKFQRYVCQYFSDSIINSSRDLDIEENLGEFKNAHNLILQIFEHVPTLLLNVIPQLEEELKVEEMVIRMVAASTLGEMFSRKGEKLIDTYPSVWKAFLERYSCLVNKAE
jgi:sister-chromatid-cohesion protein PDS5